MRGGGTESQEERVFLAGGAPEVDEEEVEGRLEARLSRLGWVRVSWSCWETVGWRGSLDQLTS